MLKLKRFLFDKHTFNHQLPAREIRHNMPSHTLPTFTLAPCFPFTLNAIAQIFTPTCIVMYGFNLALLGCAKCCTLIEQLPRWISAVRSAQYTRSMKKSASEKKHSLLCAGRSAALASPMSFWASACDFAMPITFG